MGNLTMFGKFMLALLVALFTYPIIAFAQVVPVPDVDAFQLLVELVKNWSAMGPIAIGSAVIVILVQVLKKMAGTSKYSFLAVTVLTVVYSVLIHLGSGMSALNAAIAALVAGGGAIAIWEAYKNTRDVVVKK